MVYIIAVLAIVLVMMIAIMIKRELDYIKNSELVANLNSDSISALASSMRNPKIDGGIPQTRKIKARVKSAYAVVKKKKSKNIDLYEYEKWLYDHYFALMSKFDGVDYNNFALLPHIADKPRVLYITDFVLKKYHYEPKCEDISNELNIFQQITALENDEIFALQDSLFYSLMSVIADVVKNSKKLYQCAKVANKKSFIPRYAKYDSYLYARKRLGKSQEDSEKYPEYNHYNNNIEFAYSRMLFEYLSVVSSCIQSVNYIFEQFELSYVLSLNLLNNTMLKDSSYADMDEGSKVVYLNAVSRLSGKYGVSESVILDKSMEISRITKVHFGEYLFDKHKVLRDYLRGKELENIKEKSNSMFTYLLALSVYGVSVIVGIVAGVFFGVNLATIIVMGICAFIASIPVIENIMIRVFSTFLYPKPTPRLDNNEVSDQDKTLVIMPCYVANVKMAEQLAIDVIRLCEGNKGKNITFAVLADYKSSDQLIDPIDYELDKIFVQRLQGYKDINVMVRRRTKVNGRYQGYERKRGAIMDLCDMLISQNSAKFRLLLDEDILNTPKYIVTLDSDSKLLPNSVLNAVNTMSHPLNRKYTLMTFKNAYNPYSAKSLYSYKYYHSSGVERYERVDSFYYHLTGKAIFNGKGIFRLREFYSQLYGKLPSGKILSHDILEGSMLNTGELGQEVYEDIPNTLMEDMSRQNRWQKGDLMLLKFAKNTVKNDQGEKYKSKKAPVYKYVMVQNAVKIFAPIALFVLLLMGIALHSWMVMVPFLVVFLTPYAVRLLGILLASSKNIRLRYVLTDMCNTILDCLCRFFSLPYFALNNLYVFLNTLITDTIITKNRLTWNTFASAQGKNSFGRYLAMISPSILMNVILAVVLSSNMLGIIYLSLSSVLMICFYAMYIPIKEYRDIGISSNQFLSKIALKTYKYFEENQSNNLIADNYQVKPLKGKAKQTSPTNLGFSLISDICAFHFGFISLDKAQNNINQKIKGIESLPKYKGNLYNWYDITTQEVLEPKFVSSVDSGNFLACAIVVKSFLTKYNLDGVDKISNIIQKTNLDCLYDKDKEQFYIGYNQTTGEYVGHYDMLASEARLLYYIYACTSHDTYAFLRLKRQVCKAEGNTLLSWSGTMFEYLMPRIFMSPSRWSLLDISERNVFNFATKRKCHGVFGISESGYYKFDNNLNYQYSAFGMSEVSVRNVDDRCVISPYSTFLGIGINYRKAVKNLFILQLEDMVGQYGYYEAIDFTSSKQIIYSYMAHHQGMILSSLANLLCDNCISDYFMQDNTIASGKLLLSEKQIESKSFKRAKTPYLYQNTPKKYLTSATCECAVLTNGKYSYYCDRLGNNVSVCNGDTVSKWRPYARRTGLANWVIKDNAKITYTANDNRCTEDYDFVANPFSVMYSNKVNGICENIYIPNCFAGELHKCHIDNNMDSIKNVICQGYMDISICGYLDDIAHPAFSDLFISSRLYNDGIIYHRKSRDNSYNKYVGVKIFGLEDNVYESNKKYCVDKDNKEIKLSGKAHNDSYGDVVTPCFGYSGSIEIPPHNAKEYYIAILYSQNLQELQDWMDTLNSEQDYKYLIDSANLDALNIINKSVISNKHYEMLNHMIQSIWKGDYEKSVLDNIYHSHLSDIVGALGCSEYARIICYDYDKAPNMLDKVITCYDLVRYIPIPTKLVILSIDREMPTEQAQKICDMGGKIITDKDQAESISKIALLNIDKMEWRISDNTSALYDILDKSDTILPPQDMIMVKNGGFSPSGYIISSTPSKPYCNVICGECGGIITSTNGVSFSYIGSSYHDKVTAWSNNIYEDIPSIKVMLTVDGKSWIANKLYNNTFVEHRLGESIYHSKNCGVESTISHYLIKNGKGLVIQINLHNTTGQNLSVDIEVALKLALGNGYEPRYIYAKPHNGYVEYINVVNHHRVYIECYGYQLAEYINNQGERVLSRNIKLSAQTSASMYYIITEDIDLINNIDRSAIEIYKRDGIKDFSNLSVIKIKSDNKALDILFNDILLYQTVSARLNGKCGFYQVGGATGFRDQLQDCLAYMYSNPNYVREHIIASAKRQFVEGDVLHWWHEPNKGVRTHISDDKLFLPYVVSEYIRVTGDESILDEQIPYLQSVAIPEGQEDLYYDFEPGNISESIRMHCVRGIDNALRYGEHGLLLIGSGDWNDALNGIGDQNSGESVWLTMFCGYVIERFMQYMPQSRTQSMRVVLEDMKDAISKTFKNGWYARAITKDNEWLGVGESEQCQIDLISQCFAVISGLCDSKYYTQAIKNAERLVDYDKGLVRLLDPPFDNGKYYGYISNYPKGVRENGGQYTHAVAWYIKALCEVDRDKAIEILDMINPINKAVNNPEYDTEPYVMSADVYTNGQGGWSWYTGSSAWLYKVILEDILGVYIDKDKIYFSPHYYPSLGDKINIKADIRDKHFDIVFECSDHDGIMINNTMHEDFVIDILDEVKEYNVVVWYK